jgi:limonene-1,2-epoxide hydrolase
VGATTPAQAGAAASAVKTAEAFYGAFGKGDSKGMAAAYDKNVVFHDPLFRTLKGAGEVMEMWKTIMPAANPATFKLEPKVDPKPTQNPDGSFNVKVHWDAHYDLGPRHVDNHSDTTLTIKNGKIIGQRDDWDLAAWTKQALPLKLHSKVLDQGVSLAAHAFVEIKSLFEKLHS